MQSVEECLKQAAIVREWARKAKSKETADAFNYVADAWERLAGTYARGVELRAAGDVKISHEQNDNAGERDAFPNRNANKLVL